LRRASAAAIIFPVRRAALPIAAICLLLAGTAAGAGGGPRLDPNRLAQLPAEGLAAEVGSSLVIVSASGRALGHLDGYSLGEEPALDQLAPGPRPLAVRDRSGASLVLDRTGGKLVLATPGRLRLAGRAVLVRRGGRWMLRGSRVAFVSERRDLVTLFGRRSFRVLDLLSGRSASVPFGCRAAARRGARWFLLCGYPLGGRKAASTVQVRAPGGSVRILFGPAEGAALPAGWWTSAFLSRDGSRLLLQWSGECEIPVAFFARTSGGKATTVTGQPGLRGAPESVALGWSRDGRAVVDLPKGACGGSASRPGVYLIDPASGKRAYVYRHSRFWRALS
jgi:hypothetical protein